MNVMHSVSLSMANDAAILAAGATSTEGSFAEVIILILASVVVVALLFAAWVGFIAKVKSIMIYGIVFACVLSLLIFNAIV